MHSIIFKPGSLAATAVSTAFAITFVTASAVPQAQAADIITFDENFQSCASVMCSTNGTTGYSGSVAFDLSTISSWFQIDADGVNHLTSTQTVAEPDNGAGAFLVKNDTGSPVTSFSVTLTDTFDSSTPSVSACTGRETGNSVGCDQFQANKGAAAPNGATESLSGPDIDSCSTATLVGTTCNSSGANAVANFAPNSVTYTWSGLNIAAGTTFDISFASWQQAQSNSNDAFPSFPSSPVPEPGSAALLGAALTCFGVIRRRQCAA